MPTLDPLSDGPDAPAASSGGGRRSGQRGGADPLAKKILDYGTQFLGVPYVWGGTSPQGFDCSGLIQYVYNHFGLNLPRIADAQARAGKPISAQDARPGDLVYFENNSSEAGYDHIGIYLGHGMMLAAPHTGANVQIQPVGSAAGFDRVLPQSAFKGMQGDGGNYHYRLPNGQPVGEAAMNVSPSATTTTVPGQTPTALGDSKPLTRKQYVNELDGQYGYLSAFTKIPAVKRILTQAAKNGWTQDRMLAALEKTAWWKRTTATSRAWKALQATDPGEARRQLHQRIQQIQQIAKSTLGQHLDDQRAQHLANTSIAADWSQAQIQHAIGAEFQYHGAKQTYEGAAGQTVTQLQAIAKQYVVPLSQSTLEKYARQILEGTYTTDDFQAYVQQQAESLYPSLKNALKSGQTTVQWADPYIQLASQILEKPSDQFNLANPKWSKALLTPQDGGDRKPMDLADWADYLRAQPEYKQTDQAKAATADFGLALVNAFGKVSTPSTGNLGPTAINFGAS